MAASSQSMCLRCLKRTLDSVERSSFTNLTQRAAFSTSPSLSANPPKKKAVVAKPTTRQGRTLKLTKNTRAATARPPAVGERKALRKRVVLSNNNALEVAGLKDLAIDNVKREKLKELHRQVLGLPNETVDALRALEAFKATQGWSMFRRPATLIREDTIVLAEDFESVTSGEESRAIRKVLCGERGSGKSVLQLQALAMAHVNQWVIVHIPEAKDLTNAHTSYQPLNGPDGTIYIQPHYTAKLLENIGNANQALFSKMRVSQQHNIPVPLQPNATLTDLVGMGARDPAVAWLIYQALWTELLTPSKSDEVGLTRPPVMFTVDGFDHIMRPSAYLNANTESIHAHELALVKHFLSILSGGTALPNGGMALVALSESNRATAHTLDAALENNLAIQQGTQEESKWDPYVTHDKWVQDAMQGVSVQKLKGLSKDEARGMMEYYARSGIMRSTITDGLVNEKWTMAGHGIVGQIEKATVRTRF